MSAVYECPRDRLCDLCMYQHVLWHSGLAEVRGERWAESVAARRPDLLAEPWPELEPGSRALELAVAKLADVVDDVRVLDQLLVHLQAGARRAWARSQQVSARTP